MSHDAITVHAAATDIESVNGALPSNVQWMPPGKQIVQPMGFDAPFEMDVSPETAREADRQLQQIRTAYAAGHDVEPYGDFNHEDKARAFTAKRFFWGGDDPKQGGIRLDLTWTGAGAKAVQNGEQTVISPSWVLHKITKAFLGVKTNVGGLVPRSAFNAIQAFAKANPTTALGEHAFIVSARVFAQIHNIPDEAEAQAKFVGTPAGDSLYRQYRQWLAAASAAEKQVVNVIASRRQPESLFAIEARAFAKANGMHDELEAQVQFAGTTEGRKLYAQYMESIGR